MSASNKPKDTPFRQQRLPAWQPILTPKPVISCFFVIGILFVPIGAALLVASNNTQDYQWRYDNATSCRTCPDGDKFNQWNGEDPGCNTSSVCTISVNVPEKMEPPIYFYYKLSNYYQNHRRYVKSRSDTQLRGDEVDYDDVSECEPIISVPWADEVEQPENFWLPCGLIAWSMFNDTYTLDNEEGVAIDWSSKGIAWPSDVEHKFKDLPESYPGVPLLNDTVGRNFTNEEFIVWMRTAGLPEFKKLHRIINEPIEAGTYTLTVSNQYPVWQFEGKKFVVLSTTSWIGGKNPFLGYAYIVVGCLCLVQAGAFLAKYLTSPRRLGDTSYLKWTRY